MAKETQDQKLENEKNTKQPVIDLHFTFNFSRFTEFLFLSNEIKY